MWPICEKVGSIFYIRLNRPARKNAIDFKTYVFLADKLKEVDRDEEVVYTVFTGEGDFYSSGSDFTPEGIQNKSGDNASTIDTTGQFIDALITHSKILIALVNGPAIGIGCTTLALFDCVIASEKAYFQCPFTELGLLPEGTSSFNFPAIMGHAQAAQMLLFGEKISAAEALRLGLVSRVVQNGDFRREAQQILDEYTRHLAPHSILMAKKLLRNAKQTQILRETNFIELDALKKNYARPETIHRLIERFTKRKSKI